MYSLTPPSLLAPLLSLLGVNEVVRTGGGGLGGANSKSLLTPASVSILSCSKEFIA